MNVLVIGGGVAGSAVAYFAARAGAKVTLVDAGEGAASRVPSALLNPVRGQNGKVEPRALEGLALTWALVDALTAGGHSIPHARGGVLRPVPDEGVRERWSRQLPPDLLHEWLSGADVPHLAPGWSSVLCLPTGGWLDGAAFTRALLRASGARVRSGWASDLRANGATLNGVFLPADRVVWCGGSVGAAKAGITGQHRAGSLLLLDRAPTPVPLSFGVYAAPAARGGVLGATFEAPRNEFALQPPPLRSLAWLLDRGARLLRDLSPATTGVWSGSRLSTRSVGPQPNGTWNLAGLGSKGFLLGPLLARELTACPEFWFPFGP